MTRPGPARRPTRRWWGVGAIVLLAGAALLAAGLFGTPRPALPPARAPTPTPGGTSVMESATPAATPALPAIPAAAWRRAVGAYLADPGRNLVGLPGNGDDGSVQGAPIGGLGAGSIGRTYRGDFARWHLAPGTDRYNTIWADQFSLRVARPDGTPTAQVLLPAHPDAGLSAWHWNLPPDAGTYAALYPFAWYTYDSPAPGIALQARQFSPVIPGNYQESSYPVGLFEWTVRNTGTTPADVSLLFTWENPIGTDGPDLNSAGNTNRIQTDTLDGARMLGVVMGRGAPDGGPGPAAVQQAWDGQFVIAALQTPGVTLSALGRFPARGDGAAVWAPWAQTGALPGTDDPTPATARDPIGAGLAAQVHLAPGATQQITFVLAWDLPLMQFGPPDQPEQWYRRYTEWFGKDGHHAWDLARTALTQAPAWADALTAWQAGILADTSVPTWYHTALFNELYDLVDGGTIWENGRVGDPTPSAHRFAYLECYDYPYYDTLDVRFYASFAELMLWPQLELGEMREFAATIPQTDPTPQQARDPAHPLVSDRKVAGAAPHDVGAPGEAPWTRINAYDWEDVSRWKDLNSKFVLLIYRDYMATHDLAFLRDTWPAVQQALAYLKAMDQDGDGIPENEGYPDQTYDTWTMQGVSAYCGSLWLAALEAAAAMADELQAPDAAAQYRAWFAQAQPRFEAALWNGSYYDFDTSTNVQHDSVMADQLAGEWYAEATGLPPIVPPAHTQSALATIFRLNVQGFADGAMGAVNGRRPDGTADTSDTQAQEVWTGVSYALAAFLLQNNQDAIRLGHRLRRLPRDLRDQRLLVPHARSLERPGQLPRPDLHAPPGHLGYPVGPRTPRAVTPRVQRRGAANAEDLGKETTRTARTHRAHSSIAGFPGGSSRCVLNAVQA